MRLAVALLVACGCLAASPVSLPRHGLLGIAVAEKPGAIYAQRVIPQSAAAAADVRDGDVITAVDGAPVSTAQQFLVKVHRPAGTSITLTLRRGDATLTRTVVSRAPPNDAAPGVRVTYGVVDVDGSLRRTIIAAPASAHGRLPAVFLIGGIGCFTVDTTNPQDGYRDVALDLARAGFVVHRLEKSGVGDSQGPRCETVDFQNEFHSYEVALKAFRQHPLVDDKHLYVFGHSIGTVHAPRLAAEFPVAGLIVADGVAVNWFEYELLNVQRQVALSGGTPSQVDDAVAEKEYCMHRLLIQKDTPEKILADRPACKDSITYPAPPQYLQEVAALNIAQPWMNVTAPVLSIYGGADFVTTQSDAERIVSIVNAKHPGDATLAVIPNMNHTLGVPASPEQFMQQTTKGTPTVYNRAFSETVLSWLCQREHCNAIHSSDTRHMRRSHPRKLI